MFLFYNKTRASDRSAIFPDAGNRGKRLQNQRIRPRGRAGGSRPLQIQK